MIKWIGLRCKDGEKMMLNMGSIDKIYCQDSHIGKDNVEYFIVFTFVHCDEDIKIEYRRKERRDYAFIEISKFVNEEYLFFYEIIKND